MKPNIFITGFSGSGKTSVGQEVALRLGWRFVDTDDEIVRVDGRPVEAIFADNGEDRFRDLEHERLAAVCKKERQVVSTGGGVVMHERNRKLMERSGVVICLEARPETIHQRLVSQTEGSSDRAVRPLLEAQDRLERIRALKAQRQPIYGLAHWTVHTDHLTPQKTAEEVVRAFGLLDRQDTRGAGGEERDLAAVVRTSSGDCPVWVGWGILDEVGERVKRLLDPGSVYIVTDDGAYDHARRAHVSLEAAGTATHLFVAPQGEAHKTLENVRHVYDWLVGLRAERGDLVLAVGGGVVGDLAGFVAATFLRGIGFAQVPTSLLAMLDASIGGKVGVDLPQGKNLVGAFHQPRFVLSDVEALQTLPERHVASGWAEAIKCGLILDEDLLSKFEAEKDLIRSLDRDASTWVISRAVAIKAEVVSQDEKETLGTRALLNYGHTIGHAIEAATNYEKLLHGEAVSVGMMGAAHISQAMGLLSDEDVKRQRALLDAFGLPLSCEGVDLDAIGNAIELDKKTVAGRVRWVLLRGIGDAVTRSDVPPDLVRQALERVTF